jgi:HAD superfamily hydrolase (TIGR01549 family)
MEPKSLKAVFFDVDGVLVDSLTAHLAICADLRNEFRLELQVPSPTDFKEKIVRRGIKISPMVEFFRALKFPEPLAIEADKLYQREFADRYSLKLFNGVPEVLQALKRLGIQLGIVTSNTRRNVEKTLARELSNFHDGCIFTKDTGLEKSKALEIGARTLRIDGSEILFVGDQPADYEASKAAGTQFLAVSYGWGFSEDDKEFPIVCSPNKILEYVRQRLDS